MKKYTYTETNDTRSGFGAGLLEAGKRNKNVVAMCADLIGSLKMYAFKNEFPERFFQTGIAEANMIGMAGGLATAGKIPFTGTFANFSTARVLDQVRQTVAYSNTNVKIIWANSYSQQLSLSKETWIPKEQLLSLKVGWFYIKSKFTTSFLYKVPKLFIGTKYALSKHILQVLHATQQKLYYKFINKKVDDMEVNLKPLFDV